jgi:putative DNA primase/helicase
MNLADTARMWQQAGVSVVPILANQTKRPAVRWAEFQVTAPTLGQVDEWWGNGKTYGLALICGAVSGNLEMTEIEGRACDGEALTEIQNRMDELGVGHVWDLLTGPNGYSEMSPSGGIHLLYRISDHDVPGNTKIAQSGDQIPLVLAETRGEGGYVIVAPTPGSCHPSGEAWVILTGRYGSLPMITWEERCLVHQGLALALDQSSPIHSAPTSLTGSLLTHPDYTSRLGITPAQLDRPSPASTEPSLPDDPRLVLPDPTSLSPAALPDVVPPIRPGSSAAGSLTPGDHFNLAADWAWILEPHGWRRAGQQGHETLWSRPGKSPREGHSASTGYATDQDRMWVWSTSTSLPTEQCLSKFAVYAYLNCKGDYSVAARELRRMGFGGTTPPLDTFNPQVLVEGEGSYDTNDTGNAEYLADRVRGRFLYLAEEKEYIRWNGTCWERDQKSQLSYEFSLMAKENKAKAERLGDEAGIKWWRSAGNLNRTTAALAKLKTLPRFTVTADELNNDRHLINLANGTYNLKTHVLQPHDPSLLMTQTMGAAYDPEATCPQFEGFIERVLPDPGIRSYVQRALGYSLLGEADQRSLFLICGPSGTGKSTLMATMELVFGGYAVSAPSGTLRARGTEASGPSNDLHTLRGKRFVSTSETNEHTAYNEDLIKRLTGRDQIQSRRLYQEFQSWSPRCTIWLATNHPPRFSSDDDAIWRRAKIVPFNTVLLGDGEVSDFAHNVLADELDGILNWLLAGLQAYQEFGLGEPAEVAEAAREVRLQSDPVARFLEDKINDGILILDPVQRIRTSELYAMYVDWARQTGERALGNRRFGLRIQYAYHHVESVRIGGNYFWRGLGRTSGVGVLGMITSGVAVGGE